MPPIDLTLILAATRDMGIGRNGTLPWTGLKKEMAYFARVTKRLPPSLSSTSSPSTQTQTQTPNVQNAVIMGRKTWDSIPPRFRPLAGRLNVVITRSPGNVEGKEGAVVAGSMEEALALLRDRQQQQEGTAGVGLGRVFVIGGAQIYGAALGLREARRVLLTRVTSEFECDAFFPLRLEEGGDGDKGWRRSGQEEMDAWVGEEVPRGVQTEAGTEYEFEMWERVD